MKKIISIALFMFLLGFAVPVYADIPTDASIYNEHSYKVFDTGMTWTEAASACKAAGGHLVTITSKEENDLVSGLVGLVSGRNFCWIGAKTDDKNTMRWITGETMSFTNWANGEPDNYRGNQGYGLMFSRNNTSSNGGQWGDLEESGISWNGDSFFGTEHCGYVCEWDYTLYKEYNGSGLKPLSKTEKKVDKEIKETKGEEIKGASYPLLQAKAVKVGKTSFTLNWKKLPGATKYIIYGNRCGRNNQFEYIKSTKKNYYKPKKLKKKKFYKYLVVAVKGTKVISVSKTVHVGLQPRPNPTKVKLNKSKVTLMRSGAGSTFTIKAKIKGTTLKQHRKVCYETDNVKVAKVTKKGVIKAVGPGTCNIYAYAQNGVCAKVAVTVLERK